MKKFVSLAGIVILTACSADGSPPQPPPSGGTATYRVEFSGSLKAGASFSATYATSTGQVEQFATALPASKEFTAGSSTYVLAAGDVIGGGTVTVKAYKNSVLCEEKTLNISANGRITAACNGQ
jgi:hypothetical protein